MLANYTLPWFTRTDEATDGPAEPQGPAAGGGQGRSAGAAPKVSTAM